MEENRFDRERGILSEKYGIKILSSGAQLPLFPISILEGRGSIHGAEASIASVEFYWSFLSSEWNVYPPELMAKTSLKHIILCEKLEYEDLLFGKQPRTALPDFGLTSKEDFQLFLDVGKGRDHELYVRAVIHHEFFHIIDSCDDQNLDALNFFDIFHRRVDQNLDTFGKDEEWAALNPRDFEYGKGGESEQGNPSTSVLTDEKQGFLNQYSTSGLIEDKAEIFAYMVVARDYMEERAMGDDIIRRKMQLMEKRLRAFCPQLNDQFWARARAVERPPVQPHSIERTTV